MTTASLILRSLAEITVVLFFIWGLINESKIIKLERKAARFIKAYFIYRRRRKAAELEKEAVRAKYADEYATDRSSRSALGKPDKSREGSSRKRRVA